MTECPMCAKWKSYVEWLTEQTQGDATIAWIHGFRTPLEIVEEGIRRRRELGYEE